MSNVLTIVSVHYMEKGFHDLIHMTTCEYNT